jgi:hypothetical protein
LHFRQGLESLAIDKTKMDFVCLSCAGYEKITLSVHNISFFLAITIMDEQLCELLKIALQNPKGSSESDQAAEALSLAIAQLEELKKYLNQIYLPYYEEALEKYTQPDIRKNIYRFPEIYRLNIEDINCQNSNDNQLFRKKLINWVMNILKCDCIDLYRHDNSKQKKTRKIKKFKHETISIDQLEENNIPNLHKIEHDLEQKKQKELEENEHKKKRKKIGEKLKNIIENDPDNKLNSCHPQNNQNCHCQILAQLLLLNNPPMKVKEIAKRLNVPQTTVYDRWKNSCKPLLKQIAKELGYE